MNRIGGRDDQPILTAPCGCEFSGRFYSYRRCTVLNQETVTGRQGMQHAMRAEKKMMKGSI